MYQVDPCAQIVCFRLGRITGTAGTRETRLLLHYYRSCISQSAKVTSEEPHKLGTGACRRYPIFKFNLATTRPSPEPPALHGQFTEDNVYVLCVGLWGRKFDDFIKTGSHPNCNLAQRRLRHNPIYLDGRVQMIKPPRIALPITHRLKNILVLCQFSLN